MNRAAVKAEATVVNSFTVTFVDGAFPRSASSARPSLTPLPAFGVPPLAIR